VIRPSLGEDTIRRTSGAVRIMISFAALFTAAWLAGCASRVETPYVPGLEPTRSSLVRFSGSEFDYIDHLPHPSAPITGEEEHYWVKSVVIPSVGDNLRPRNPRCA
jgi:hypothetical protein